MSTLTAVRAYVVGESIWSKAQKDAVYYLTRYSTSHAEADYEKFKLAITITMASKAARVAIQQDKPDLESAKLNFMKANNHPDDFDGMVQLFLNFQHTRLMEEPIALWTVGDGYVAQLKSIGEQLHALIKKGQTDDPLIDTLIERIDVINHQLTPLEVAFSSKLGEVSRTSYFIINTSQILITLLLIILGILFTRRSVLKHEQSIFQLIQNETKLRGILDTSMDAVIQMNVDGLITGWSGQAVNLFGWSKDEAMGQPMHNMIIPVQYREAHVEGMKHFLRTGVSSMMNTRIEIMALKRDGAEFPVELTISQHRYGNEFEFCAFIRDITNRKKSAEKLLHLAHYDMTTGLPNRVLFYDRLTQEIKKAQRAEQPIAVMLLDLDHFKEVNDTLGHDKGDLLLKEVAWRLNRCIREADTLARLGGDEFTLILSSIEDNGVIERLAEKILQRLSEPFKLDDEMVYISASIGITLYPDDAKTIDELLKNADQAMYEAKNQGRNRFRYFTPAMQTAANARVRLSLDLRSAVANQQFLVLYQPIINLHDLSILKAEALIRWHHPIKGLIDPIEFIPIAEETGLVVGIGDWVFQQAALQVAKWRLNYHPEFQISVNKSPIQFYNLSTMHASWFEHLQTLSLPGESIVIEITESLLLGTSEHVIEQLLDLRQSGFMIAIDDFGTGYSSLSYLKKFQIDFIKIDQSFVSHLALGSNDLALCEAMIVMAHKLGIQVIAEGVETIEQRDLLIAAGCDYAQGYLFSKPVTAEEFEKLFSNSNKTN